MIRKAGAAALAAGLLGLASSCGGTPTPPPGDRRVVVLGVDGATWDVLSPLMAEGRLAALAGLYRSGSAGVLIPPEPLSTAALWTSLATGRLPADHGIGADTRKAPGRYALRPATADRRGAPALWTIAGSRGLTVGVAGWPVTFPVESVNGYMVADVVTRGAPPGRGEIYPQGALGSEGGPGDLPAIPISAADAAALDEGLSDAFLEDLSQLRQALSLYRVYQPRLAFFRIRSVDYASHRFWQYHRREYLEVAAARGRRVLPERAAALAAAVPGAYAFLDACVDLLLESLPETATVLIVSPHGIRGVTATDDVHVDLDFVLDRLGLSASDAAGRREWSRTIAFSAGDPGDVPRGVYLNLAGREASGIVRPSEADAQRHRVAGMLRELRPDSGAPLFRTVTVVPDPLPGDPDIQIEESPGVDPDAAIRMGGVSYRVVSLYRRYGEDFGTHDRAGVILAAGRGVAAGRTGWQATLQDVAPTILALLGLPQAPDMPGVPLAGILTDPAVEDARDAARYADLPPAPPPVLRGEDLLDADLDRLREAGHLHERGVRAP